MKRRAPEGIIIALCIILLAGVFQWLPNGLVFLGRVFHVPIRRNDAATLQMLRARIAELESEHGALDSVQEARVQLSPGFVFSDSLVISAGTEDEIQEGDLVISPGGIAVGVITEIGKKWSKAGLISQLGNVVALRIGNAKEFAFEARGVGGGELYAEFPSAILLRTGDPVWLGSQPKYIAGIIDGVDSAPGRQLQQLTIRVPISIEQLYRVFVVRSSISNSR